MRPTPAERLARAPLFARLSPLARTRLAAAGVVRTLRRGAVLFRAGARPDALALVLSGRLDVVRSTARGRRLVLRSLGPDAIVGVSLVAGQAATATLAAGDDSTVLILPGVAVRALFYDDPELALSAIAHLSQLVDRLTDEREAAHEDGLDARVARCLATLGAGLRELRLTHQDVADRVGATRPNVTRALARLARAGAIRCRRGRIELLG